jgi:dTDP-4-amino-4,6-dideoxygalactose transaminase
LRGGAIISKNRETKLHIDQLKNFGFVDEITLAQTGINGKMSEFNAALGLVQLKHIDEVLAKRRFISDTYKAQIANIKGISCLEDDGAHQKNYSYFPSCGYRI